MSTRTAEFLLALALALRGLSLIFAKVALQTMGVFLLVGTRFIIAFVVITIIFNKQIRNITFSEVWHSAILSLCYIGSISFECLGLKTTAASTTAFLENSVVVLVPLVMCIIHWKLPESKTVASCVIAMAGLFLLTAKGVSINFTPGELLVMCGAFCYVGVVIITDYMAKRDNLFVISVLQLFFIGIYGLILAFLFEDVRMPSTTIEWGAILGLAIICSGVGFTLQPFAQKYMTAERAGLFACFNPLSAAVLGVICFGERLSIAAIIGCVLIGIAVILDRKSVV